jgi:hypothetical protein
MSYIGILSRKFMLKLAQDPEAESLLKKRLDPTDFENPVFEHLVQRGIIPIIAPRRDRYSGQKTHTAFLGSGVYSEVYEVSYKGKLAVAKITPNQSDFDIMLKLDALKPKLGNDAKHLPVVLDKFSIPVPNYATYYVIIVEKLEPLSNHLSAILFRSNDPYQNDKPNFNANKNNLDLVDASTKIFEKIKSKARYFNVDNETLTKILELIDRGFRKSLLSSKSRSEFKEKINIEFESIKKQFRNDHNIYQIHSLLEHAGDVIAEVSNLEKNFPVFYRDETDNSVEHFKNSPEAKDFIKFLLRLKKEFGISWGDLHGNNIMVRPSTGDLIVSDSGYFKGIN